VLVDVDDDDDDEVAAGAADEDVSTAAAAAWVVTEEIDDVSALFDDEVVVDESTLVEDTEDVVVSRCRWMVLRLLQQWPIRIFQRLLPDKQNRIPSAELASSGVFCMFVCCGRRRRRP